MFTNWWWYAREMLKILTQSQKFSQNVKNFYKTFKIHKNV